MVEEETVPYRKYSVRALYLSGIICLPLTAAAQTSTLELLPGGTPLPPAITAGAPPVAVPDAAPAPEAPMAPAAEAPTPQPAAPPQAAPAQPANPEQVNITAPRSSGIAAIVNDTVISDYDLDQRTALYVATSGLRPSKENLAQIRAQVLRSLEDEVLELQEANKHKVNVTKADVDKALKNIADDNHVTIDQIAMTIKEAGVSPDVFRQQLAAQLTWQRLVSARYSSDVQISDQQVDEAMGRLKQGADKPQFEVSEIFLSVNRPEDENTIKSSAEQIANQIKQGAPFAAVATQFSQSPSAADGGNIGWVVEGQLPEELDKALDGLHPGDIAGPIKSEGGYYVVLLRDRREPLGTKVEQKPEQAVTEDSSLPLARMLIPVPPTTDQQTKDRAMQFANGIKQQVRSCQDLSNISKQVEGTKFEELGPTQPRGLADNIREALLKSHSGDVIAPFFDAVGLEVFMRCDPAPAKIVAVQLPTHDELQQQLFVQQMAILGKSYLTELRRDAVVETR
ncbi:MAG TPA: peptidylprolyl isomerase [Micropepsaceae bacterium]|nr:peptidylprolyl isomerase [Micropepsaceae bacterium]